jgi:hypothetical protein
MVLVRLDASPTRSGANVHQVPIIVIFTKFDALDNKAFKALRTENISRSEALRLAPKRALDDFETTYRESLSEKMRLAKARVFLRGINFS